MSLPKISEIAGGYQFDWLENEKVQIKVSRLHDNRDGNLKGELLITTSAEGYSPHLHYGQFNFLSGPTRKKLANDLRELYDVNWPEMLEQLVVYTTERVRRGEPAEELMADNEQLKPPEYFLEPFIIKNYPNVFFGEPGSVKSTTALIVLSLVILPWTDNPLKLKTPDRPIKCLYLDWETDRETILWQLNCIQNGMETGVIPLGYRRCSLPLADDLEQIQRAITDMEVELIVIDSLGLACGEELKEAGPAIRFFAALRSLKCTSLTLAHTSKGNQDSNKTIYGSVFFEAQARNIWQLKKRQDPGDRELDLMFKNTKSPPFKGKLQDIAMHMNFGDNSIIVSRENPRNVAEFLEHMGIQDRILEAIKINPMAPKEISELFKISPEAARMNIKRLKDKKLIVELGNGKYGAMASNII